MNIHFTGSQMNLLDQYRNVCWITINSLMVLFNMAQSFPPSYSSDLELKKWIRGTIYSSTCRDKIFSPAQYKHNNHGKILEHENTGT